MRPTKIYTEYLSYFPVIYALINRVKAIFPALNVSKLFVKRLLKTY